MKRLAIVALGMLALAGCGAAKHEPKVRASVCFYTQAGNKLCGEDAFHYCEEVGDANGRCLPILEEASAVAWREVAHAHEEVIDAREKLANLEEGK